MSPVRGGAPRLRHRGAEAARTSPPSSRARSSGCSSSPSRAAAPTSPARSPPRSATATSGSSTAPRSGPPAPGGPTGACAWPAPTGTSRSTAASRCSCSRSTRPASRSTASRCSTASKEFCQEFLTDVRVPDTDRVGEVDDGWTVGTRWMFHERMAQQLAATSPARRRRSHGGAGRAPCSTVARASRPARRPARPRPRRRGPDARARRRRSSSARIGAGHRAPAPCPTRRPPIGRLFGGDAPRRGTTTIAVRARRRRRRRVDRRRRRRRRGRQRLPHAPGRLHRRRHHRDGPQRHQRAGARHAAGAQRSTATSPFRDVPRSAPH